MDSTLFRLVFPAVLAGSLLASAAAQGEGEMVIGREVPARPAIRHGDPSPDVSRISTAPSSTMPTVTQQLADPLLAATHAVMTDPALRSPGLVSAGQPAWSVMPVGAAGSKPSGAMAGTALPGVGMGQLLQSALHP